MEPSTICTKIQKLLGTIRFQLQQLEDGTFVSRSGIVNTNNTISSTSSSLTNRGTNSMGRIMNDDEEEARANLTQNLNATFQELALLDRAITENGGVKRDYYRKKHMSLYNDTLDIRKAVERYLKLTYNSRKEKYDRDMLLYGRGTSTTDAVAVDAFLAERASLTRSHAVMDDITAAAENVLGSLKLQRNTLKTVHRKVLDVGSALGMSTNIMRLIERRTTGDKILVYGGMIIVTLLLVLVLRWRSS